jgi:hypothetical protein
MRILAILEMDRITLERFEFDVDPRASRPEPPRLSPTSAKRIRRRRSFMTG